MDSVLDNTDRFADDANEQPEKAANAYALG
jgi:hypothetical protein